MEYQDKELTCADCGQAFTFTAGEQEFYERKGFKETPKRCRPCREARKSRRRSPGSRDAGSDGDEDGGRPPRETFEITCASCGQPARVPFRPSPGRPVYCRDCYASRRANG